MHKNVATKLSEKRAQVLKPGLKAASIVQPKLAINQPGDRYEQEADAMADRVMRMTEMPSAVATPQGLTPLPLGGGIGGGVYRKCAECEKEEKLHRKENATGEAPLLMRQTASGGGVATPALTQQLSQSKGGGSPLPMPTLQTMSQAFGTDFSGVHVHTDSAAAQMSQGIQARAFTHGSDIYFNRGEYRPGSGEGRRLLAHELTHVVQQGGLGDSKTSRQIQRDVQTRPGYGPLMEGSEWGQGAFTPESGIRGKLDSLTLAIGFGLGRRLTDREKDILRPIFGRFLNYSIIRICERKICSPDKIPRTVGNLIAAPDGGIPDDTLIHEAAHVWQHQNGVRYGYIISALGAQAIAAIRAGRGGAYDWGKYCRLGLPWATWNAEAQAKWIEDHKSLPPTHIWAKGGLVFDPGMC